MTIREHLLDRLEDIPQVEKIKKSKQNVGEKTSKEAFKKRKNLDRKRSRTIKTRYNN